VIYSYNKNQQDALISQLYFGEELYGFRTDLLSIIRSLNTVFTATGVWDGICRVVYQNKVEK
jgi:hypothetical protein